MSAPIADAQALVRTERKHTSTEQGPTPDIDAVRTQIEQIDLQLIGLIAQRVRHGRELGRAKRALLLPVLDPAREASVVRRAGELAREAGLSPEDVREIFWHLIGLSRRAQQEDL